MGCINSTPRTSSPSRTTYNDQETSDFIDTDAHLPSSSSDDENNPAFTGLFKNIEIEQCRETYRVAANLKYLLKNYNQVNLENPANTDRVQELKTNASQLMKEIQEGLRNETLQHPDVYKLRADQIQKDYMALATYRQFYPSTR